MREGTLLALMVPVLALRSFSSNAGPSVCLSAAPPISGCAHGLLLIDQCERRGAEGG